MRRKRTFEDLIAWRKAHAFALAVYEQTRTGALSRDWDLSRQSRRASVSVVSNIAEGFERGSRREFAHFLSIARGSAGEARAQLRLARDLGVIDPFAADELLSQALEVSRVVAGLLRYLRDDCRAGSP